MAEMVECNMSGTKASVSFFVEQKEIKEAEHDDVVYLTER